MPRRSTKYRIGRIYPTAEGTWRAWVNHEGTRQSKTLPTLDRARFWIEERERDWFEHLAPLSAADQRDFHEARRILPEGVSLADAARCWRERNPAGNMALCDAVQAYLDAKESANLRTASLTSTRLYVTRFMRAHPDATLADITPGRLLEWFQSLSLKPVNWNNHRRNLSGFFRWCMQMGWTGVDPAAALPAARVDRTLASILTVDQSRKLLDAAREHEPKLLTYIVLGLFAGLRPTEAYRIQWNAIGEPDPEHIHVAASISKRRTLARYVELLPVCRAWLDTEPAPRTGPIQPFADITFRRRFRVIYRAAGIDPWPRDVLRHTFGAHHLALYQDAPRTSHQMGHQSTAMLYAHYRNLVTPEAARAYFGLCPSL